MKTVKEKILAELHERAGRCTHCFSAKCEGKKSGSTLPPTLKLEDVLAAIDKGVDA